MEKPKRSESSSRLHRWRRDQLVLVEDLGEFPPVEAVLEDLEVVRKWPVSSDRPNARMSLLPREPSQDPR